MRSQLHLFKHRKASYCNTLRGNRYLPSSLYMSLQTAMIGSDAVNYTLDTWPWTAVASAGLNQLLCDLALSCFLDMLLYASVPLVSLSAPLMTDAWIDFCLICCVSLDKNICQWINVDVNVPWEKPEVLLWNLLYENTKETQHRLHSVMQPV